MPIASGGSRSRGQEARAEERVPHDHGLTVVVIRLGDRLRVMPAVQLGHAEEVVQRAEPKLHVGVLEDAVHGGHQREEREHLDAASQHHEQPVRRDEGQQRVDRVEAAGVQPVEPRGAVVRGVEAPEAVPLVLPAVDPVARQLAHHERQRRLREQRPARSARARRRTCAESQPAIATPPASTNGVDDAISTAITRPCVASTRMSRRGRFQLAVVRVHMLEDCHHAEGRELRREDRGWGRHPVGHPVDRPRDGSRHDDREYTPLEEGRGDAVRCRSERRHAPRVARATTTAPPTAFAFSAWRTARRWLPWPPSDPRRHAPGTA